MNIKYCYSPCAIAVYNTLLNDIASKKEELIYPSIAGVVVGTTQRFGHFVAILGKEGDTYTLADPLNGKHSGTYASLSNEYKFTGFFLKIIPQETPRH